MKQKTLKGSFSLCGKGLHTGLSLTVTFNPAPPITPLPSKVIETGAGPSRVFPSRATVIASAGSVASVISFRPSGDLRTTVSAEAEAQAARAATARRVFFIPIFYQKIGVGALSISLPS